MDDNLDSGAYVVVLVTMPSAQKAAKMARILVEERLAACANIVPLVRSIYRWEGKVHDESEALMMLKTLAGGFQKLKARVLGLHEYTCPEIVALPLVKGHQAYLDWIRQSVEP